MHNPNLLPQELITPPQTDTSWGCFDDRLFTDGEQVTVPVRDGRNISVNLVGPEWGVPVVYLAGNPSSNLGPHPYRESLEEQGILYVGIDRANMGRSDKHPGHTILDTAHDIEDVADQLRINKFGIVARSAAVSDALDTGAALGERVTSIVAFGGLKPREAKDGWDANMTTHNVQAHNTAQAALKDERAKTELLADFQAKAALFRKDPRNFIKHIYDSLKPGQTVDLKYFDRGLEIAMGVATGVGDGVGWTEAVLALQRPWGRDVGDITAPTILWRGGQDPFSGEEHSPWFYENIPNSWLFLDESGNHFAAVHLMLAAMITVRDISLGMRRAQFGRALLEHELSFNREEELFLDRENERVLNRENDASDTQESDVLYTKIPNLTEISLEELTLNSLRSPKPKRVNPFLVAQYPASHLAAYYPELWNKPVQAPFTSLEDYIEACLPGISPPLHGKPVPEAEFTAVRQVATRRRVFQDVYTP